MVRPPFARTEVALVASALGGVLLVMSPFYGPHRDELYFASAGQHLAWGYPDQPSLVALVARLAAETAPHNLVLLRLPSLLTVCLVVVLAAMTARLLGGGRRAQVLAALTTPARATPSPLTVAVVRRDRGAAALAAQPALAGRARLARVRAVGRHRRGVRRPGRHARVPPAVLGDVQPIDVRRVAGRAARPVPTARVGVRAAARMDVRGDLPVLLLSNGKAYYLSGAIVPLLAAGCVVVAQRVHRFVAVTVLLALSALVAWPAMVPVLPARTYAASFYPVIDQDQLETIGWPELVDSVRGALEPLPDDAIVFTGN